MSQQFEINFDAGLVERYPNFADVVNAAVHGCRKPFKAVAADLDMSSSSLSQKIDKTGTNTRFDLFRLPELLKAVTECGERNLIAEWLVEFCFTDVEADERRLRRELLDTAQRFQALMDKLEVQP